MSAAVSWDTPARVTTHLPVRRAHLRSVSTGNLVDGPRSLANDAPFRLTRRGRLCASVGALVMLVGAGIGVAAAHGEAAVPSVTVQADQTLSEIAHSAYPQLPIRNAVARVQEANALNSNQVQVGQRLQLPR